MKTKFRIEALEQFEEMHNPAIKCQPVPSSIIDEYAEKLPDLLQDVWLKYGWCGFAKGFFWFVNPNDYLSIPKDWLKAEFNDAYVFARTAFGDLFFLKEGTVYILIVQWGEVHELSSDLSRFMGSIMCYKDYLKNGLLAPLFKKALTKLGTLEADECYAIVPALALGGEQKIEYLQKTNLQAYLALLSQLHQ